MEVLYTQDLPLDDLNHDLDTPKYGLWNEDLLAFTISLFL